MSLTRNAHNVRTSENGRANGSNRFWTFEIEKQTLQFRVWIESSGLQNQSAGIFENYGQR